jgi:hypothetical protein
MIVAAIASRTRTIAIMPPIANAVECRRSGGPCPGIGIQWNTGHVKGGGACGGTEECTHPLLCPVAAEYIWPVTGGAAAAIGCWYMGAGCGGPATALGCGGSCSGEVPAPGASGAPH